MHSKCFRFSHLCCSAFICICFVFKNPLFCICFVVGLITFLCIYCLINFFLHLHAVCISVNFDWLLSLFSFRVESSSRNVCLCIILFITDNISLFCMSFIRSCLVLYYLFVLGVLSRLNQVKFTIFYIG